MNNRKLIRDPVHGYLELNEFTVSLLDSFPVQRLRRIKQLGFSNLVYPGANHTRFEHSLGVMYLASLLAEKLDDEKLVDEIRAASLLHDVGHPPFSHVSEGLLKRFLGKKHEELTLAIKKTPIRDILQDHGVRAARVIKHIVGESKVGVIHGDLDVDRMDYLVRDSYYTGVAYGLFDHLRLIKKMRFMGHEIVLEHEGIKAAESMLVSRFFMYPTVYFHHVSRIARKMYERAMKFCIVERDFDPYLLLSMDDSDVMVYLRHQEGFPGEIARMLDERRLYKRALYVGPERVDISWCQKQDPEKLEEEIAEMAGVDVDKVIVDIPPVERVRELEAKVITSEGVKKLENVSGIVNQLKALEMENWKLGVYSPKEIVEVVGKASIKSFNVEKRKKQYRLDEVII